MTIPMEVMAEMASIGLSQDQARAVASMLSKVEEATKADAEAIIEAGREKARDRWHKWDEKRRSNVGKREQTLANTSRQLASAEDKTSNSEIEHKEESKNGASSAVAEFRSVFDDLDGDHLDALVAHRKFKKAPLTKRAAELFRRDVAKCTGLSIAEAVDTCISRNWITVKPEWLGDRRQQGPPPRANPVLDVIHNLRSTMETADAKPAEETERHRTAPRLLSAG